MKIIDLSKTIEYKKSDPWFMRIKVKNYPHKKSVWLIRFLLGLPRRLFPAGFVGWADDKIMKMGVHATTHIDAPWHYGPEINGEKAKTIDEVPLEWLYGPGVVIDVSHKTDYEEITIEDIKASLTDSGAEVNPGTIVLIKTGRDKLEGYDYVNRGLGMSKSATEWLIDQGVKVMGIDQWGFDLPLKKMVEIAKKKNDSNLFWQAHLVGIQKEYLHIEQLIGLDKLPAKGFHVAVFPLKIKHASGAPARVVAMINE